MFSFKAENLYEVVKPLHLYSRMFGLTSFSVGVSKHKIDVSLNLLSVFCVLYPTIWSLSTIGLFFLVKDEAAQLEGYWVSNIFEIGIYCFSFGFTLTMNLDNWWSFFSRKQFSDLLNVFKEVDEELSRNKSSINYVQHKKIVLIVIIGVNALALLMISSTALYIWSCKLSFTYFVWVFSLTIFVIQNIFVIFHFLFWIWAVKIRYQKINFFLNENFLKNEVINGENKLNVAAVLHDKLVDTSELINQCYGVPVNLL